MVVEKQPYWRAGETKLPPYFVFQEAAVRKVNEGRIVNGEYEGRRMRARLGHVVDAEPLSLR